MIPKEVKEANSKFKNPERRINAVYTGIIVSVLWGSLSLVTCNWGSNLLNDNRKKDSRIDSLTRQIQDCNDKNYDFIKGELEQERQVREFKNYQDSMNHELKNIKETLTSK